jgi:hypothetical protein
MRLHENTPLFRDAVRFTAQQMNIRPEYIEKDYWVTYALFSIFSSESGKDAVFKGGTSLSKCYGLIERFSEDIDLVVLRREGESDNRLKAKLKTISSTLEKVLPENSINGLTTKFGMNRKTAHSYKREFTGNFGQVRDVIVLESTWLGNYEPFEIRSITSFVGQMMLQSQQAELAQANGLLSFDVPTLTPNRTICEKIMSLVRFSYSVNPIEDLKKKIRHIYDLHQLLQHDAFSNFLNSSDFEHMILKVAKDDMVSFRNNNTWLNHHPAEALIFERYDVVWKDLKATYQSEFKNLVYGVLPGEEEIQHTLLRIQSRLKWIEWNIKINKGL